MARYNAVCFIQILTIRMLWLVFKNMYSTYSGNIYWLNISYKTFYYIVNWTMASNQHIISFMASSIGFVCNSKAYSVTLMQQINVFVHIEVTSVDVNCDVFF